MRELVVRIGASVGQRFEITHETSIGRANAGITVTDVEVSRRHASVRPVESGIEIEDLGSTNGTWVNGQRIGERVVLRHGDVVRVGRTELEVVVARPVDAGPVDAPAPADPAHPTRVRDAAAPAISPVADPAPPPAAMPPVAGTAQVQPPVHESFAPAVAAPAPPLARRGPATRSIVPIVLTIGTIGITAVLLVLYFALRG